MCGKTQVFVRSEWPRCVVWPCVAGRRPSPRRRTFPAPPPTPAASPAWWRNTRRTRSTTLDWWVEWWHIMNFQIFQVTSSKPKQAASRSWFIHICLFFLPLGKNNLFFFFSICCLLPPKNWNKGCEKVWWISLYRSNGRSENALHSNTYKCVYPFTCTILRLKKKRLKNANKITESGCGYNSAVFLVLVIHC